MENAVRTPADPVHLADPVHQIMVVAEVVHAIMMVMIMIIIATVVMMMRMMTTAQTITMMTKIMMMMTMTIVTAAVMMMITTMMTITMITMMMITMMMIMMMMIMMTMTMIMTIMMMITMTTEEEQVHVPGEEAQLQAEAEILRADSLQDQAGLHHVPVQEEDLPRTADLAVQILRGPVIQDRLPAAEDPLQIEREIHRADLLQMAGLLQDPLHQDLHLLDHYQDLVGVQEIRVQLLPDHRQVGVGNKEILKEDLLREVAEVLQEEVLQEEVPLEEAQIQDAQILVEIAQVHPAAIRIEIRRVDLHLQADQVHQEIPVPAVLQAEEVALEAEVEEEVRTNLKSLMGMAA